MPRRKLVSRLSAAGWIKGGSGLVLGPKSRRPSSTDMALRAIDKELDRLNSAPFQTAEIRARISYLRSLRSEVELFAVAEVH